MSDWKTCTLGDITHKVTDGAHYSPKTCSTGFPMASVKDMECNKINISNCRLISEEDYLKLVSNDCKPLIDDVLIAKDGSYLKHVFDVTEEKEIVLLSSIAIVRPDKKNILPRYLKYVFLDPDFRSVVESNYVSGAVIPRIILKDFKKIEILLPPLPEQRAIGEVLSSLDDKIDLLHRQNKTLEALAETLFRHHFIDNAQDDWEEKQLDEIADYLNGLACQKHPPKNDIEKLPVLKIKDLRNGFTENSDWATSNVAEEYIVKNGDIIFSWSGSLLVKIWDGKDCVLNQHLFKVTSAEYPKWFIYHWTKYHLDKFTAIAESKATTMGHIKRSDLSSSMVVVPTEKALNEIDQFMQPIIDKVVLNNRQISRLEKIRDTLLPKLISGDVRVQYEEVA